jgi:hypothetical protein
MGVGIEGERKRGRRRVRTEKCRRWRRESLDKEGEQREHGNDDGKGNVVGGG